MEITYRTGNEQALWPLEASVCVYLVFGEEDLLKQQVERALIERFSSPDFADFDLEIVNADTATANSVLNAASQAPFASPRRVVVVRGMEQWRGRTYQAEADKLAAGIPSLTVPACLVLIAGAEEDEARRKTAVSPKLDAAVKEFGMYVACRGLRDEMLFDWITDRFKEAGKRASKDAIELLVSSVGSEMRALDLEIYKLINYVGERHPVTAADVSAVVATEPEDVMFQCVDAISKRQTDRALSLLHELHRHDPKPQAVAGRLLALLVRQYRLMWQAKHLSASGLSARDIRMLPAHIAADLPSENSITQVSFKVAELLTSAQRYTVEELRWSFERLVLCDLANKGGVTGEDALFSAEPASNLQLLVLQLTGVQAMR